MRTLVLEDAYQRVLRSTSLRKPQRDSLEAVHALVKYLDRDISELSADEIRFRVKEQRPQFEFGANFPTIDFLLATGVGKTRLMGAIMAYLFLSGQSKTFVLLAPRRAILRKLISESRPRDDKYLFVDPGLVPDPEVWHSGNLEAFAPPEDRLGGSNEHPEMYILSPHSLTGNDRRAWRPSEFTGTSLGQFLASRDDLVVLVDEAHHLGGLGEEDAKAWTEAVRSLNPKIQFGMTATPIEGANVLYSYDLATCLQEGLYTKAVRVIVDEKPSGVDIDPIAWDRRTVDFALARLKRKEHAIAARVGTNDGFPAVRPVLLICAENTSHADAISKWLIEARDIDAKEILVTHSKKAKTEEELQRLLDIQESTSPIRIVVNVFELTEGWDVTNVYVIAPLRRMGTFQGAVQTMGRGLRLPAGRRVDDPDLDTLDVLCFGSESLEQILDSALHQFGEPEDDDAGIQVVDHEDEDLDPPIGTVPFEIRTAKKAVIDVAHVQFVEPKVDLPKVAIDLTAGLERGAVEFDLKRLERLGTSEKLSYDRDQFRRIVASRVIQGIRLLNDLSHRPDVDALTETLLQAGGSKAGSTAEIDPNLLAEQMKGWIREHLGSQPAQYAKVGPPTALEVRNIGMSVPEDFKGPIPQPARGKWLPSRHRRIPIGGWTKCVHECAAFDTSGEFGLARVLDSSMDVNWWFRNSSRNIRISTPVGGYEPDLVALVGADEIELLLIQSKGDHLWETGDSRARLQARAAEEYCRAQNAAETGVRWIHTVVLQSDAAHCRSVDDIKSLGVSPTPAPLSSL